MDREELEKTGTRNNKANIRTGGHNGNLFSDFNEVFSWLMAKEKFEFLKQMADENNPVQYF
jgi:hypothetical protein